MDPLHKHTLRLLPQTAEFDILGFLLLVHDFSQDPPDGQLQVRSQFRRGLSYSHRSDLVLGN